MSGISVPTSSQSVPISLFLLSLTKQITVPSVPTVPSKSIQSSRATSPSPKPDIQPPMNISMDANFGWEHWEQWEQSIVFNGLQGIGAGNRLKGTGNIPKRLNEQPVFGAASPDTAQMRAAILARVSTDGDEQDPSNQLDPLRAFAISQGLRVTKEYVDHESGSKTDRPQFNAMMNAAAKREFDVLLFWSLDRLSREGAFRTLTYLNTLSQYGVAYRSYTEPYLDSAGMFSDAIIAILATIAKQERVRIVERVRAGIENARRKGTKSGNPIGRPRAIFDRYQVEQLRKEGLSLRQIASRLAIGEGTVRRILRAGSDSLVARQNPNQENV